MIQFKPDIKYRLVNLREDPQYSELKPDFRRSIRYIEGLERELISLRKQLSKSRRRQSTN
jgi:hypothetical protein